MKEIGEGVDQFGRRFRRLTDGKGTYRAYSPEEWFGWDRPPLAVPPKPHPLEGQKATTAGVGLAHQGHHGRRLE